MNDEIELDAHAVLLPAFDGLSLDITTREMLRNGTVAILLGENREEYVARMMSPARVSRESKADFLQIVEEANSLSGDVIVAVDQELPGIQRLHNLVTSLPDKEYILEMSNEEIEVLSEKLAQEAKSLGVNLFLSPIVDVVLGANPWLSGRTLGEDIEQVARITSSFIRGVQKGGIAATAKHFPGHHITVDDPALFKAFVPGTMEDISSGLESFKRAIENNVKAIMMGPAVINAIDPVNAASVSKKVINLLRSELGFQGLIISDDLGAKSVVQNDSLENTAVSALKAGIDLLLVGAGPECTDIIKAIINAVKEGELDYSRLKEAATRVRKLARELV
jgi:beta-N-acetylhexosaminidase